MRRRGAIFFGFYKKNTAEGPQRTGGREGVEKLLELGRRVPAVPPAGIQLARAGLAAPAFKVDAPALHHRHALRGRAEMSAGKEIAADAGKAGRDGGEIA